jgi:exodeoxyribonuclease V alpha subunit
LESIEGTVLEISFHDAEGSGFCVLRVSIHGREGEAVVIGEADAVRRGQEFSASGTWTIDPRRGTRFRAAAIEFRRRKKRNGIVRLLASDAFPGIGTKLALKIVERFENDVVTAILERPEEVAAIPGVGTRLAEAMKNAMAGGKTLETTARFLLVHDVSPAVAGRIRSTLGHDVVKRMTKDPYALTEKVLNLDFRDADAIARENGMSETDPRRLKAAVAFLTRSAARNGSVGMPTKEMGRTARSLLRLDETGLSDKEIIAAVAAAVADGEIAADDAEDGPALFDPDIFRIEERIAERLLRLSRSPVPWKINDALAFIGEADERRDSIERLLSSPFSILSGRPGTGKTTCLGLVSDALEAAGLIVTLAGSSASSAARISKITGKNAIVIRGPKTGTEKWRRLAPIETDVLIIDEASSIESKDLDDCLDGLPAGSALILVGDPAQIPPIGPGTPFADLVKSGAFVVEELRSPARQPKGSALEEAVEDIRFGRTPAFRNERDGNVFFLDESDPISAAALVTELAAARLPKAYGFNPETDVLTLSPVRGRLAGTNALNEAIRDRINPKAPEKHQTERGGRTLRVGDKVAQARNDEWSEIRKGEIGTVAQISDEDETFTVNIEKRRISRSLAAMDAVELAYANTIHGSQGGEAECVVIPILREHLPTLDRNLLYAGITRARRFAVLVGCRKTLETVMTERPATTRLLAAMRRKIQTVTLNETEKKT